mgnify:CR=1 FL=1
MEILLSSSYFQVLSLLLLILEPCCPLLFLFTLPLQIQPLILCSGILLDGCFGGVEVIL